MRLFARNDMFVLMYLPDCNKSNLSVYLSIYLSIYLSTCQYFCIWTISSSTYVLRPVPEVGVLEVGVVGEGAARAELYPRHQLHAPAHHGVLQQE